MTVTVEMTMEDGSKETRSNFDSIQAAAEWVEKYWYGKYTEVNITEREG